jgi:hypothetical protein
MNFPLLYKINVPERKAAVPLIIKLHKTLHVPQLQIERDKSEHAVLSPFLTGLLQSPEEELKLGNSH